jgi:hypothetical protein
MRALCLLLSLVIAGCGLSPAGVDDGAIDDLSSEDGASEGRPASDLRAAVASTAPAHTPRAMRPTRPDTLGEPRALHALPRFLALARRHPRAVSAFAADGSYLLLDARGRLHAIAPSGRANVRALGARAGRADGLAFVDGTLVWYRARAARGRGWPSRYYRDLELHVSRDGGRSFATQVARQVVGNVGYVLRVERTGRLRLWTGAEFRCGGGAYTRFDGRLGQDAGEWERDDSLGGAEAFPEPPRP